KRYVSGRSSAVARWYRPSFQACAGSVTPVNVRLSYRVVVASSKPSRKTRRSSCIQPFSRLINRIRRASGTSSNVLRPRSEEHTSELQSRENLVCRLLLEKKQKHEQ